MVCSPEHRRKAEKFLESYGRRAMGEQQRDIAELRDEGARDMIPKRASEKSLSGGSLQTSL